MLFGIRVRQTLPEIILATWAAILNCDSKYFGRKVYSPATGRMWRTLLAVRKRRMSFFNKRRTAFGKSLRLGFLLRTTDTTISFLVAELSTTVFWPLIGLCCEALGLTFVGKRRGKANIEKEAKRMVEATKIMPAISIESTIRRLSTAATNQMEIKSIRYLTTRLRSNEDLWGWHLDLLMDRHKWTYTATPKGNQTRVLESWHRYW